jgi:Uma2 family endonuclease
MAAISAASQPTPFPDVVPLAVPRLETGDQLTAAEFLRRYEAMPAISKAELIEGTVYMSPPVRLEHAEPDTTIQTWLGYYAAHTPGTRAASNATVRLDADNVAQPDALLRLLPECRGRARADQAGYLCGAPELIVEVAASSAAIDLHDKLKAYRRAGVREYLVWRTLDRQFDWFVLDRDEYRQNAADAKGILRSSHFPGLVLDAQALLAGDSAKVLDTLRMSLQDPAHAAFVAQLANTAV